VKRYVHRNATFLLFAACAFLAPAGRAQAPKFTIYTVAGNGTNGYAGDGGPANQAELSNPCKLAVDASGNLYIADQTNARIRQVSGANINTFAGNGTAGYTGDGKPPTQANISTPCGMAVDSKGNVYFSQTDAADSAVREAPASGNMSTITGTSLGAGYSGDGGKAINAQVNAPAALAFDPAGNLYIADTANNRVRIIRSDGSINTFAGNGIAQYSGDGGPAFVASLNTPQGIAADSAGNVYIADTLNQCIRKVTGGFISTVAGTCRKAGFSGDGGKATAAQLNYPKDVAVDSAGNLYIADSYNFRIRMVAPDGTISTIAGGPRSGYKGDGGLATSAQLSFPQGVAVGPNGVIYVADTGNNVVRLLTTSGVEQTAQPPVITSVVTASACGGYGNVAPGAWIEIHGSHLATDTRTWATSDFQGNTAPVSLDSTQVSIGGQNAVVLYISPTQVNVQVPLTLSPGPQQITATANGATSLPYGVTVTATQAAGLCQGVTVAGNPYVAAVVNNSATYILPSTANVANVSYRPAHPGEVISFFGNGFGPVTPSASQGQIVQGTNQLTTPFQVFFGPPPGIPAQVQYAGLAPGFIGLYQFNVVVPNIPDSDLVPVTFALGNFAGAPTLYTAVKQQ